jgi:hypothetical protein
MMYGGGGSRALWGLLELWELWLEEEAEYIVWLTSSG